MNISSYLLINQLGHWKTRIQMVVRIALNSRFFLIFQSQSEVGISKKAVELWDVGKQTVQANRDRVDEWWFRREKKFSRNSKDSDKNELVAAQNFSIVFDSMHKDFRWLLKQRFNTSLFNFF